MRRLLSQLGWNAVRVYVCVLLTVLAMALVMGAAVLGASAGYAVRYG